MSFNAIRNAMLLAAAINMPTAQAGLNDTGITTCSNLDTNGLTCPVSGFPGQDAEYGTNKFDFTKLDANGNTLSASATNHACVRDNVTGLTWEVKTDDGGVRDKDNRYTFDQAAQFASAVNTGGGLCGFTDWRVPHMQELTGIVDRSIASPGPTIATSYFPNTVATRFWSAVAVVYPGYTDHRWGVSFFYGYDVWDTYSTALAVRLVRGAQVVPVLFDNGDGTVTDSSTGLMWAKCAEGRSGSNCAIGSASGYNWGSALTTAQNATLAGYSDWRLPNVQELRSLVDYSHYNPTINTTLFPNTDANWFWSSSPYASGAAYARVVSFASGDDGYSGRNYYGYLVRLVRPGQLFALRVTKLGSGSGAVTSTPAGINCGEVCSVFLTSATDVTLTATAQAGSGFAAWGVACSGTTSTCNLTMNADKEVTATFTAVATCSATWTPQTSNTTSTISSVVWNSNKYLAVGTGGTTITSTDGATWTTGTVGTTNNLNSITWSGSQFVAVSGELDQSLIYTSNDGLTWAKHTVEGSPPLRGIVWNGGLNKLIAVGEDGTILIGDATGQSWIRATSLISTTLNAITSSGSIYIAVGTASTIITSTNGTTWTQRTVGALGLNLRTVLWNGQQFLTAGDGSKILVSLDGLTWTPKTVDFDFYNIEWNGSRYTAVGPKGIITSFDGQNWSAPITAPTTLRDVIWNGSQLIAVGNNGTIMRSCVPNQANADTAISYDPIPINGLNRSDPELHVNALVQSQNGDPTGNVDFRVNGRLAATYYDIRPATGASYSGPLQDTDAVAADYQGNEAFKPSQDRLTIGDANNYGLSVQKSGAGTVTTPLATWHINCGTDCQQNYPKNRSASVTLRAIPDVGHKFTGWSGSGCSGTSDTCTVTMDSARTITATFATSGSATKPSASTDPPSNITTTSATLKGWINDNGATTTATFDFGTTTSYGTSVTATPGTITANTGGTAITASRTNLQCGTKYYYRAKAVNSIGTTYGLERSFTTTTCPVKPFCQQCLPSMQGWRSAVALIAQLPNLRRTRTMAVHKITPLLTTGGGTISPATMRLVLTGTKAKFTITPNSSYIVFAFDTCGATPSTTIANTVPFVFTTRPIAKNCLVNVSFVQTQPRTTTNPSVEPNEAVEVPDPSAPAWHLNPADPNFYATTEASILDADVLALPTSGSSAFDFTKLNANGQDLPVDAEDYTCLRDNATGLIWEVKTQDGGLQDQNWSYTWYDANKPGGQTGTASGGTCYTVGRCDSEKYTHDINVRALCGGKDWRLPTIAELATIANSPLTQHQPPTWAAFEANMVDGYNAMVVDFTTGHIDPQPRSVGNAILLVR